MAKIMIVDDSLVMRKNLKGILVQGGHDVIGESMNGKQAYIDYINLKPDLVTMDISMPIMDGIESVKRIMNFDQEARIVMVSAIAQKKMVFQALECGACHYILKPISPSKVLATIDVALLHKKKNIDKEKLDHFVSVDHKFLEMDKSGGHFYIKRGENAFQVLISKNFAIDQVDDLTRAIDQSFTDPLYSVDFLFEEVFEADDLVKKIGNLVDGVSSKTVAVSVLPYRFWEDL